PIGSDHITSDIAIGLRTSLEVAEQFKRSCVSALASQIDKREELDLRDLGADSSEIVSTRYVSSIVQARVEEIFEKVEHELQKIERSGMLPVGAILTGGGVKLKGVVDVAKAVLRLPASVGVAHQTMFPLTEAAQDPAFTTAIGLVLWGFENEKAGISEQRRSSGGSFMQKISGPLKKVFKSFIP
ncbi:MAG: cell division FtsA domain-containing protein, partial [bacterium]|nr:cell division FtsA domain-containing protein [bacterium]